MKPSTPVKIWMNLEKELYERLRNSEDLSEIFMIQNCKIVFIFSIKKKAKRRQ